MVEFYSKYFSPQSKTRARISVHLKARGAGELDSKIIKLLEDSGIEEVPQEKRQSVDLLRSYVGDGQKMAEDTLDKLISQVKDMGLSQQSQSEAANGSTNGLSAVDTAQEITDVRQFKAGLQASSGARPVKQLSEFEESDAKL